MDNDISLAKKKFVDYINHIVLNNKISHTYLIEIDNYDYDMEYVFLFIKMILTNSTLDEVLNKNDSICQLIDDNNYPDLRIIEPDGSFIKKNQLLDLQKDFSNTSLLDGKRIYIIKEADKLNVSSANTMLKFLEEPSDNIIALLLTTNRYLILDTILSRCQILNLKDNFVSMNDIEYNIDLFECVLNPRNFFIRYKFFLEEILVDKEATKKSFINIEYLLIMFINYYYLNENILDDDIVSLIKKNDININYILNVVSILEEEIDKLSYNINYKLWVDSLFSKFIIGGYNS